MKRGSKKRIDTIEKLAVLVQKNVNLTEKLAASMAEDFGGMNEQFDKVDARFVNLESEVRNGFEELRRILDRHDTRISLLELKVFGPSSTSSVAA